MEVIMKATLTVTRDKSPEKSGNMHEKEIVVLAKCIVKVGYVCTVYFPTHHDADSYRQHNLYHNQNAKVVNIRRKGGLDLEITSGPVKGSITKNVDPTNLFFWGPFISQAGNG